MRPELPTLIKARMLITDPAKWGQGARGTATTCCVAEAIEDVTLGSGAHSDAIRRAAYRAIARATGAESIVDWNDVAERTHGEVLAAFDRAIEAAT